MMFNRIRRAAAAIGSSSAANRDELLARLADARDLTVSERERENLCAAAHTEITRLAKEMLALQAALEEAQQSVNYFHAHCERLGAKLAAIEHGEG